MYEIGIGRNIDGRDWTESVIKFQHDAEFYTWLEMADLTPFRITYSSPILTVMESNDGRWIQIDKEDAALR